MVLVFELRQFVAQAGGFVAILLGLEAELGSGNAANRIENLGDGVLLEICSKWYLRRLGDQSSEVGSAPIRTDFDGAQGKPNANSVVPAAMATYCCPSIAYVIGPA